MGFMYVICAISLFATTICANNKYSKESNINFGKTTAQFEHEINVRTLERPFRMAKLNLLWTKAQVVNTTLLPTLGQV